MRKSTHSSEYAVLRRRLVGIRTAAELSQRGLARLLGVPHSWVAKVESGERRIDLVEFAWFCDACGVSAADVSRDILTGIARARPKLSRKLGGGR